MCGINGFTFSDEDLIRKMNQKIKHRGPDDEGVFACDGISLGHVRLSIIDLSPGGHQPMMSEDASIVIVFNGEIYNYQELREELKQKGKTFRSTSDTEVILRAYEVWGIDCVEKFNGIFAIGLWDKKREALYLIRDHVGVKPLYYYRDPSTHSTGSPQGSGRARLVFSSEIKAILAHNVPRQINTDALNIYFRMLYVPAPMTMFKNIFKVEPGSYLRFAKGQIETKRYWHPDANQKNTSKREAIAQIQFLMKDSVKRQLISERPVGVFLSGGIDSTAILGLATEVLGKPPKTFTAGFDVQSEKFNADLALAKKTAAHYQTDHHELIVTGVDCAKHLEDVIYHMDEPVANATQVATYLLSKFARQNIVVGLGGDGGDELFGGYERYRLSRIISIYQKMPKLVQKIMGNAMHVIPHEIMTEVYKMETAPGAERYLTFMAQKEKDIAGILLPSVNDASSTPRTYEKYFTDHPNDPENDFMRADLQSWLPDESLVRSDKLSMAFALEQRVPILDYRLIELSRRIPSAMKLRGASKGLFREAMRPYLPSHVVNEKKRGWTSPASIWLRTALRPLVTEALTPSFAPATTEWLDFAGVQKMLDAHLESKEYHMNLLWAVLTFQLWYRRFFYDRD